MDLQKFITLLTKANLCTQCRDIRIYFMTSNFIHLRLLLIIYMQANKIHKVILMCILLDCIYITR
jgi:hypothetical protein